jgi:O-antigen ligase
VTAQKNMLGQLAGFGLLFWLHAGLSRERPWGRVVAGAALSIVLLGLSRSSTSAFATVLAALLLLILVKSPANMRRLMPYIVTAFAALVVAYALAILKVVPAFSALLLPVLELSGKDMTFTNRSAIWAIVVENIQQHPWLGSGYGGYWTGPVPGSPSYRFVTELYFYPTESHNGYLELISDLGVLGLVLLLAYLAVYLQQSLKLIRMNRAQGALYICLFFQQAVVNLSESMWLNIGSFPFVLMTIATFALARALFDERLRVVRMAYPSAGTMVASAGRSRTSALRM